MTFIVRVKREKGNKKIIPQRKRKRKEKKKKISISFSICHENVTRKKTAWNKTSKKDRIIFLPVQVHHKSILQIPTQEEETRKCSRIRNRETLRDTLSDSQIWCKVTRQKTCSFFFFFFFPFFFSLRQKSKRSKYRRNDKSNSVACVKKKGFPSFSRRFFPCRFTDQRRNFFPSFPEIEPIELKITDGK